MTIDLFTQKCGYEINGMWMPRVTAITSIIPKPNLERFLNSYANPFAAQRALEQSADWGNLVHGAVEGLLVEKPFVIDARISPSVDAFRQWLKDNSMRLVNKAQSIERRVFDMENCYAGTIDVVAKLGGKIGVLDIKTGSGIWREHALQTAAYLNAYNKNAPKTQKGTTRWILRIDQYEECMGCFAKRRLKEGAPRVRGGNRFCNHQWGVAKAEIEFKELPDFREDIEAFLAAKELWEWHHRDALKQIGNYPKKK
ncbi:MAG: hypothetical protein HYW95_02710 [Candidatus Wildermuthbacteria bacterium]|nr:hypothetical protein [Candidatus Wildermuthbacteria bacterium]